MQVTAGLIMMAIMGCNDSATKCVQLSATQPQWATVAACDKATEKALEAYSNANYPMVIAVCQSPQQVNADAAPDHAGQKPPAEQPAPNLAEKTFDLIKKAIPTTDGIKSAFTKPVHVIADGYTWVARKFRDD